MHFQLRATNNKNWGKERPPCLRCKVGQDLNWPRPTIVVCGVSFYILSPSLTLHESGPGSATLRLGQHSLREECRFAKGFGPQVRLASLA